MKGFVPTAAPVRQCRELTSFDEMDRRVSDMAVSFGACEARYPALIAAEVLQRAEYPQAFPHLLMRARPLALTEPSAPLTGVFGSQDVDWYLSPAVCYHVYAQFTGCSLRQPLIVTAKGHCFRREVDCSPGIRQLEFEMREIVILGSDEWVRKTARKIAHGVEAAARTFGLSGVWRAANDPFFLPSSEGKAALQRLTGVKREYRSLADGGLALASVNRHGAFFGERFHIIGADGHAIHSACIAVGLDRWFHAAFADHRAERRTDVEVVP